jgi:hypothetical protein
VLDRRDVGNKSCRTPPPHFLSDSAYNFTFSIHPTYSPSLSVPSDAHQVHQEKSYTHSHSQSPSTTHPQSTRTPKKYLTLTLQPLAPLPLEELPLTSAVKAGPQREKDENKIIPPVTVRRVYSKPPR